MISIIFFIGGVMMAQTMQLCYWYYYHRNKFNFTYIVVPLNNLLIQLNPSPNYKIIGSINKIVIRYLSLIFFYPINNLPKANRSHLIEHFCFFHQIITGLIVCLVYRDKGVNLQSVIIVLLFNWFFLLSIIDINHYLLPNFLTYPLIVLGFLLIFFNINYLSLQQAFIGMICGYGLLKIPARVFYWLTHKNGLGGGDIKLLAALGTWIPYYRLPQVLILACILAMVYCCLLNLIQHKSLKFIAFGPFLLVSGWIFLY